MNRKGFLALAGLCVTAPVSKAFMCAPSAKPGKVICFRVHSRQVINGKVTWRNTSQWFVVTKADRVPVDATDDTGWEQTVETCELTGTLPD